MRYSFKNDYTEGAHPRVLEKLIARNLQQENGYGDDIFSVEAKRLLHKLLGNSEASLFFASGGTQTNLMVIAHVLRSYEAVISADTGHIVRHETGAIEAVGHKVLTVATADGKLDPDAIEQVVQQYAMRPHMVKPRLVYISNSTEIGTHYRKSELEALHRCCRKHDLLLFMDGARLGHALMAASNDLTMADIHALTDVFYIGGTKNGALLGEAIVFANPDIARGFDYILKQKGALLAKGRLLGIQFLALFEDALYFQLAAHANAMAQLLKEAISEQGYGFLTDSETNQIFPILPNRCIALLQEKFQFLEWKEIDSEHTAIRLITSWATEEEQVKAFIAVLQQG